MNELIAKVNNEVTKFFTEKQILIMNNRIYVSIFSNMGNGFARSVSPSDSIRMKEEFFKALNEYNKLCIKGVK